MSSVNDIMAVLLEAPVKPNTTNTIKPNTNTTTITSTKPGRGRPAGRGNKQISSSITITSKPPPTNNQISITPRPAPSNKEQMLNKQTNKMQQQAIGIISPAQSSRLEKEFVKV